MQAARQPPAHPVPAVLAVVWRGGRVLLVRRANPPHAGHWGFPGGRLELGETLAAAALRELREETGVAAAARGVVDALDALTPGADGAPAWHYVLVAVACDWRAGEPRAGDDALEAGWFDPDALPAPLCPDVAALAERSRPQAPGPAGTGDA
ncbi:MAG TPA: NUDIX hydrolase [Alphaproteobacteria bacterium]|nr:NUDIX hydrolase [Alphaproteobacteria bacterium]